MRTRSDLCSLTILEGGLAALFVSTSSPLFVLGFNLASEVSFGQLEQFPALSGGLKSLVEFFLLLRVLAGDDDGPVGTVALHSVATDDSYDLLLLLIKLVEDFRVSSASLAALKWLVLVVTRTMLAGGVAQRRRLLGQQRAP